MKTETSIEVCVGEKVKIKLASRRYFVRMQKTHDNIIIEIYLRLQHNRPGWFKMVLCVKLERTMQHMYCECCLIFVSS